MKRRIFLKGTTASIAGSLFSFKSIGADDKFDVAIIGAGLSGLNAALELEKYGLKTVVLEAFTRLFLKFPKPPTRFVFPLSTSTS